MKNLYLTILMLAFSFFSYGAISSNILNMNFLPSEQSVCTAVDLFYATNTTINSTDIGWNPTNDAIEYVVNYRQLDDSTWFAVSVADDSLTSLYALDTCSGYEFFITTICSDFSELESLTDTFFTLCDTVTSSLIINNYGSNYILYPNPASRDINIQFNEPVYGDMVLKIYNSSGTLENEQSYTLNGETIISNISFYQFTQGLKYVSINYNGQQFTKQLFLVK